MNNSHVSRAQRSTKSAFTRVCDALWVQRIRETRVD
jgi:hypothetical protein